ncbi:sedoheptulokinase-like [Tubulanus polymorphus]|uniref:sedoheptulokinase-like n=1 Tax=Tubulanus polymorphus TaxID=672921 RepID=UPI003DA391B3
MAAAVTDAGTFYVLGLDLGTTSVKAALVDSVSKKTVHTLSRDTKAAIHSDLGSLGNEQDPGKIVTALQFCVSGLPKDKLLRVKKIGISGQMHGVVFWKASEGWIQKHSGRYDADKASQLITWQDSRCTPEFLASLPERRSHLRLATGHGCATIFWLNRNDPGILDRYDRASTIQDYVVAMLCNLDKPAMSVQTAASWGFFDTVTKSWNMDRMKEAGFPVRFLPEVFDSGTIVGSLQTNWYNIPQGTPVGAGLGDLQCSILSSIEHEHDAVLNISTSAQLAFQMPENFIPPAFDPTSTTEYLPYFNGRYLGVAASLTGGNTMAAFIRMLQQWTHQLGLGVPEGKIWERVLALGHECQDSDLEIIPTIYGERHKPDQVASVSHITTENISLGSVYRSLCKGIIKNLHDMFPCRVLKQQRVQRIVGSGSALTKNHVLQKEVEAQYSLPVVYGNGADAAVGVALAMML